MFFLMSRMNNSRLSSIEPLPDHSTERRLLLKRIELRFAREACALKYFNGPEQISLRLYPYERSEKRSPVEQSDPWSEAVEFYGNPALEILQMKVEKR